MDTYVLDANPPPNALHGGREGFDKRGWSGEAFSSTSEGDGVSFTLESADGDQGYPGNLRASMRYVWTEDRRLVTDYTAETDAPTPFNPTQHSYWNLAGASAPSVQFVLVRCHIFCRLRLHHLERLAPPQQTICGLYCLALS